MNFIDFLLGVVAGCFVGYAMRKYEQHDPKVYWPGWESLHRYEPHDDSSVRLVPARPYNWEHEEWMNRSIRILQRQIQKGSIDTHGFVGLIGTDGSVVRRNAQPGPMSFTMATPEDDWRPPKISTERGPVSSETTPSQGEE